MKLRLAATAAGSVMVLGACAEGPKTDDFGYEGTGIQFSVAPLTLDSLSDACYSFAITNEAGDPVVGRGPGTQNLPAFAGILSGSELNTVCASQFGNGDGGDVSYVAPCDADEDTNGNSAAEHTVTLWVDALCSAAVTDKAGDANWEAPSPNGASTICDEIQPYQNPCGTAGCSLPVTCEENADTPVTFNFTIMGQADQGFFDIAVNFEDIFCSAKVDCEYSDGSQLNLLHNPNKPGSPRDQTIVLGRACTAGPGEATQLHSSSTFIVCGYTEALTNSFSYFVPFHVLALSPHSDTEGNLGVATPVTAQLSYNFGTQTWDNVATPDYLFQTAVYHGEEALSSGGTNLGKVYWNHAIGIDWDAFQAWVSNIPAPYVGADGNATTPGVNECRVVSRLTATDESGMPPSPAPANTYGNYPIISSDVTIWVDGPDPVPSTLQCTAHPLNGSPGGVRTVHPLASPTTWIEVRPDNSQTYAGLYPFFMNPYLMMTSALLGGCRTGDGVGQDLLTVCP